MAEFDVVAMFFKLYYFGGGLGESVRYFKENIQNLPIPKISAEQEKEFEILVDEIIDLKSQNKKFKRHFDKLNAANKIEISEKIEQNEKRVDEISNEIDAKVFEIYSLTDDEIKLILSDLNSQQHK
ncbi:hypothetical protein [Campylobacter mucosalis]|uniref:hypothetical protein n=2 Tax=Campylobacter mucosalis TaxID=202 RepID=UPI0014706AB2|nr:hypothetical protein [Campylobacter mucosalis]